MSLSREGEVFRAARAVVQVDKERWRHTVAALSGLYGMDRTLLIIAGFDDATNADLAKWRALGMARAS